MAGTVTARSRAPRRARAAAAVATGAALLAVAALGGRAAAEDTTGSGVLGLVHRLALRGDTAALERMLSGSTTGGVVDPTLRARVFAELGRYDEAVAEYRRALEAAPHDPDALFGWADVELRRGHPEVARDCMTDLWQGSAAPPLKAEAVRRQLALAAADTRFDAVDWGAAIGSIDDPDLAWRLLDALVEAADSEGALFLVEQATSRALGGAQLTLGPALVLTEIALRVGDLDRAAASVAELERGSSAKTGSVRALAGEVALGRGQAVEAVKAFGEARASMPTWTRMLDRRASAARAAGDSRTAESDLRALAGEAIALEVRDRARATLVEVLLERQRYADAARVYVEAVAGRGPERRGVVLDAFVARVDDPRRARPLVSGATVASEAMGELHRLAAELAARAGDEANTLRELELALDTAPADAEILERLAVAERQAGRLDRAIVHYRAWAEREPRRAAPLTGWVAALRQSGQLEQALDTGRTPSRARPADPDAWALTGTVLGLAGFTREACDALGQAHQLAPERASFTFDLAVCLEDLSGGREPIAMLERLLAAGSGGAPWQRVKVLERLRAAYAAREQRATWSARVVALAAEPATVDRAGLLLDAAGVLVRTNDLAEASALYDKVVAGHPGDPRWAEAALAQADAEAQRGRAARAEELWRAVAARPDLPAERGVTASLALGESLRKARPAQALEEWNRCAERHAGAAPGARCRLRRARAFAEAGRAADASGELIKLLANPARDVETTRGALSLLASTAGKGKP